MARLEPGRYRARCLYHTMTVNSSNNPEMRLTVLPFAGVDTPSLPPNYKPAPITIFMTITAATMGTPDRPGWVLLTLKHLGFTSSDMELLDPNHECPFSFTGREVQILGSEDEYKGKKRTRWNIIRNEIESKPIAASVLKGLSDKYAVVLQTLVPKEDLNAREPWDLEQAPPPPPPGQLLPNSPPNAYDRTGIKESRR